MPEQSAADRLRALAKGDQHRPDSARLRDILAEVEAALDAGVTRAAILAELHAAGFTFTQRSFESALYRARKKQKRHEVKAPKVNAGPAAAPSTANPTPETDTTQGLTRKQVGDQLGDQYVSKAETNPYIKRLKAKQEQEKPQ